MSSLPLREQQKREMRYVRKVCMRLCDVGPLHSSLLLNHVYIVSAADVIYVISGTGYSAFSL